MSAPAYADIFVFIDSDNEAHYANHQITDQYQLFIAEETIAIAPLPPLQSPPFIPMDSWHERAAFFSDMIDRVAKKVDVRPALLRAVILTESAFDPRVVSRAGAQGLMQLIPKTAMRFGVDDPFDPEQNITGGGMYLNELMQRYNNNMKLVLAAYNAGEDAVDKYGGRIPPYKETRHYVPTVLKYYQQFEGPTQKRKYRGNR